MNKRLFLGLIGVLVTIILFLVACSNQDSLISKKSTSQSGSTASTNPSWNLVADLKVKHSVFYAGFLDAHCGVTVGYGGTTYYTSDGGQTWHQSTNEANCRFGLDILNTDYLWTVGNYGGNRVSINGGASLFAVSDLPLIDERPNNLVSIVSQKDVWLASPLRLAHTLDAGLTWTDIQVPSSCDEITGLYFYSSLGGYVLDRFGTLFQTVDGGQNWTTSGKLPTVEGIRQTQEASVAMRIDSTGRGILVYLDKDSLLYSFIVNLGAKDSVNTFTPLDIPEIKNCAPYLSQDAQWLTATGVIGHIEVYQLVNQGEISLMAPSKKNNPMAASSYCGIDCTTCRLYMATMANDEKLKATIMGDWHQIFNWELDMQDMQCLGCKSSVLFKNCAHCDIKDCASQQKLDSCSTCNKYPCQKIQRLRSKLATSNPGAKLE